MDTITLPLNKEDDVYTLRVEPDSDKVIEDYQFLHEVVLHVTCKNDKKKHMIDSLKIQIGDEVINEFNHDKIKVLNRLKNHKQQDTNELFFTCFITNEKFRLFQNTKDYMDLELKLNDELEYDKVEVFITYILDHEFPSRQIMPLDKTKHKYYTVSQRIINVPNPKKSILGINCKGLKCIYIKTNSNKIFLMRYMYKGRAYKLKDLNVYTYYKKITDELNVYKIELLIRHYKGHHDLCYYNVICVYEDIIELKYGHYITSKREDYSNIVHIE